MKIYKACSTPEEAALLYGAINDFTDNGSRVDYANWLLQKGETARSKQLFASITAYNNLDVSPLDNFSDEHLWEEMVGVKLLRNFINLTSQFERDEVLTLRNALFSNIRPALSLTYEIMDDVPKIGMSYFWGQPDLKIDDTWPLIEEASNTFEAKEELPLDHSCAFAAQVSFPDFKDTILGQELPSSGGFSLFTITEVHELGVHETVLRKWDNTAALNRVETLSDLLNDKLGDSCNTPNKPHTIIAREVLSIPDATSGPYAHLIPNCKWGEKFWETYCELLNITDEELHGIGGYLRNRSGEDQSPDTDWMRFATLSINPDGGTVHFAVKVADWHLGKIDKVKNVWTDWD